LVSLLAKLYTESGFLCTGQLWTPCTTERLPDSRVTAARSATSFSVESRTFVCALPPWWRESVIVQKNEALDWCWKEP